MARIGILFAIPAAYALARGISSAGRPRTFLVWIVLGVICCLEQVHAPLSYDTRDVQNHVDAIRTSLENEASDFTWSSGPGAIPC